MVDVRFQLKFGATRLMVANCLSYGIYTPDIKAQRLTGIFFGHKLKLG